MLLSHCDEHLVGAVQLLSILHPHDVGFRHSLNGAAEPDRVPLGHRLIGWMFGEGRSCRRDASHETGHQQHSTDKRHRAHSRQRTPVLYLDNLRRKVKGHVLPLLHEDHHHDIILLEFNLESFNLLTSVQDDIINHSGLQ